MPALDILFIIVISVMAISVFLSIVDWIYLSSIASKLTLLEREIEKKSLEFDALKKERTAARSAIESTASVIEPNETIIENASSAIADNFDTIQIVRNIRGNFEQSNRYSPPATDNNMSQQQVLQTPYSSDTVSTQSAVPYSKVSRQRRPEEVLDNGFQSQKEIGRVTAQSAGTDGRSTVSGIRDQIPFIIKLYSETTKDADFKNLWKAISARLQSGQNSSIVVDMSGINFIYEKEMDYLEKISSLLIGRGGCLQLINCDNELFTLLKNRPQLLSIVKRKAI